MGLISSISKRICIDKILVTEKIKVIVLIEGGFLSDNVAQGVDSKRKNSA